MTIDHDVIKNYTETFVRAVGATERTGARGTLPQPAPDNANSIWLTADSLYGNDGNPGTQASPKLTPAAAISALGGALATVHMFRPTGSTIDIIFTHSGSNLTLPASNNIQVEEGELATIEMDSNHSLVLNDASKINGLIIKTTNFWRQNLILASVDNATIANCTVIAEELDLVLDDKDAPVAISADQSTIIEYCVLISSYHCIDLYDTASVGTGSIDNNIFYSRINNIVNTVQDDIFLTGNTGIHSWANGSGITVNVDRCLFVNAMAGISDAGDTITGTALTWNISNSSYYNVGTAFSVRSSAAVAHSVNINFDYCKLSVINGAVTAAIPATGTYDPELDVGVVITITNTISTALPNMFLDLTEALDYNVEGFRLQHEGQTTLDGTGKYSLTSPLVGIGGSGVDISPFDETVVFASIAFNDTLEISWPPELLDLDILHQNPANLRDVNGNLDRAYDTKRRKFSFTFGAQTHVSNMQMKQIGYMLSDNGSKRFFPMGRNVNMFEEDISSTGVFSNTDNSIVPTVALATQMVPNWWQGFWINIAGDEFYIESNDETKLYLLDKLDLGFPSDGLETFIIESLLVNLEASPYAVKQPNFTSFRDGGFLREDPDETVRPFDYSIETITFEEIEDIKENV